MTISRLRTAVAGASVAVALAAFVAVPAGADAAGPTPSDLYTYRVTITNLTKGQPLSPPVLATHRGKGEIFSPGKAAIYGVRQVAENGNTDPLYNGLVQDKSEGWATDAVRSASGPVVPAGSPASAKFATSVTLTITARRGDRISWASMLGCTNDGFAGFDGVLLPKKIGKSINAPVRDYDAGTEENTEDFADLVGGCQGAIGVMSTTGATGTSQTNPELAEGEVIRRHEGVDGVSDDGLRPEVHGWKNPVAKTTITRIA